MLEHSPFRCTISITSEFCPRMCLSQCDDVHVRMQQSQPASKASQPVLRIHYHNRTMQAAVTSVLLHTALLSLSQEGLSESAVDCLGWPHNVGARVYISQLVMWAHSPCSESVELTRRHKRSQRSFS